MQHNDANYYYQYRLLFFTYGIFFYFQAVLQPYLKLILNKLMCFMLGYYPLCRINELIKIFQSNKRYLHDKIFLFS